MRSQKTKFVKLWDRLVYPERTEMKTVLLPKTFSANRREGILLCSNESRQTLLKLVWIVNVSIQSNFRRICMESSDIVWSLYLSANLY